MTTDPVTTDPVPSAPAAYFERLDEHRVRATEHTAGAWSTAEQHIAPTIGLIVHEVERHAVARPGMAVSRISVDILGVLPIAEMDLTVEVLRPGRTIELIEVGVACAGRAAVRARVWRSSSTDTASVAGGDQGGESEGPADDAPASPMTEALPESMPAPEDTPVWDMTSVWPGGYIASLDVRRSADARPGRARAWVTSPLDLVAGEDVSVLARWVSYLDTANGICVREDPRRWMFPNLDLTAHLHREPVTGPTGLDTTVVFGPGGLGLTASVLHDVEGLVGRLAQTLTLRPLAR